MRATNSAHQNTSDKYHLQTQIAVGPIVKKHQKKKAATTLREFIWKLKKSKLKMYYFSWDITERVQLYSAVSTYA